MSDFYGSLDLNLYEILSIISDGGQYGTVFKAKNASNICAMKIFKKEIDDTTPRDELKNFIREISNISRTNHPAIVKFIGFSPINLQDEFKPVIITEYLTYNLRKLIDIERNCKLTGNKLDETQKHKIIYGIARAMEYLHEHDIIHRDLKPDNILLTDKMEPKICDFGFSKCIGQRKTNISNSGIVFKGTPLYSAPEVLFKNKYSKSGDVYAFGMLVYELYSIEPPFKNCTFEELCINIANGVKPEFDISFPEVYKSLIINCLDYDPLKRPTFKEIADDLGNRRDFFTDLIDEAIFLEYADNIDKCPKSLNDNNFNTISIDQYKSFILEKKKEKARGYFILSKNLFFGTDIQMNKKKSAENCKKAALLGDIDAIFNYALFLYNGEGVQINIEEAEKYFKIAYQKSSILKLQNFFSNDKKSNDWVNELICKQYIKQKQDCYEKILGFFDNCIDYQELVEFFELIISTYNKDDYKLLFKLILNIGNNYHRNSDFGEKIYQIINYFHDKIKQAFANFEIFNFFITCKLILLLLFESNILNMDINVYLKLTNSKKLNKMQYIEFFYPEIKKFVKDNKIDNSNIELLEEKIKKIQNFDLKRHKGENDLYICSLIRDDLIDSFIKYVNNEKISLYSIIKPSIFETNLMLIRNEATLIDYAAFFGSIKIFNYLLTNGVKPNPFYATHCKNFEVIYLVEKLNIFTYNNCIDLLCYSISFHNNDLINYFVEKYASKLKLSQYEYKEITAYVLSCTCFSCFCLEFCKQCNIFDLYYFGYDTLVNLLIMKENQNNEIIIIKPNILNTNSEEFNEQNLCKHFVIDKIAITSNTTSIRKFAFDSYSSIIMISIPSSVTSIEKCAFIGCKSLVQISIPPSVTSIGESAFAYCSSLNLISIPSSVTSIEKYTFHFCTSLVLITIPSSVTSIGEYAFFKCKSLIKISVPSSVTSIGKSAFSECTSLKKILIPSSVTSIGAYAFYRCFELKIISIPSFLTFIKRGTFCNCKSLTQISIPPSVTSIEDYAFLGCSSLIQITIPSSVTEIGNDAFNGCSSLTQIEIPSSVISIGDFAFSGCSSLKKISIQSDFIYNENAFKDKKPKILQSTSFSKKCIIC